MESSLLLTQQNNMAQDLIFDLLSKVKKPLSRSEIAQKLNIDPVRVSHAIKKMLKYSEVKAIEIDRVKAKELYNSLRRMRLYYI